MTERYVIGKQDLDQLNRKAQRLIDKFSHLQQSIGYLGEELRDTLEEMNTLGTQAEELEKVLETMKEEGKGKGDGGT